MTLCLCLDLENAKDSFIHLKKGLCFCIGYYNICILIRRQIWAYIYQTPELPIRWVWFQAILWISLVNMIMKTTSNSTWCSLDSIYITLLYKNYKYVPSLWSRWKCWHEKGKIQHGEHMLIDQGPHGRCVSNCPSDNNQWCNYNDQLHGIFILNTIFHSEPRGSRLGNWRPSSP